MRKLSTDLFSVWIDSIFPLKVLTNLRKMGEIQESLKWFQYSIRILELDFNRRTYHFLRFQFAYQKAD